MRVYIDFDDVICETAKHFCCIAKELFDIDLPYQEVQFFNLKKSFDLDDDQYEELMKAGHLPQTLLAYEETPGASETINKWVDEGHEVSIVTGRPFDSYGPSRRWLDEHGLERVPLYCVDKYGREQFTSDFTFSMTLEQLYGMTFDFAVEDSPAAFEHVLHFDNCKVAIYNRPWNVKAELPNENFVRCADWKEIDEVFRQGCVSLE
jgi:5'(3')-deoxyribonucleotidase